MTIKLKYDSTLGFYQVSGSISNTLAAFEVSPSQTGQNILSLDIDRAVSIKTSQTVGINEVSGSILSLKGRSEGLHFHVGGNQYLSNNSWFDADTGDFGSWIYETDSSAFRYGFRSSSGAFEIDWAAYGATGDVVTFGTGISMTGSNGGIAIGKKCTSGLSATFDITGSNSIALAVTGSADIGGGAADAYFIPPRLTSTQRDALTAKTGMFMYNTTTNKLNFYNGSSWTVIAVD
tara:strand:+ start:2862 stop:3563 length:702 start_codon:yes stop_codon:yes gene_type:complete